ncbi:MAG: NADH:flavin oxidoreductase [Lachnospiraceae bacterium]|nr:NADH:flavin oxidoreductase [Lachnospiraceae bacterium]
MSTADTEIKIGKRICKNRITMAPTVKFNAGEDGIVTDFFVKHYELRAKHGVGFICVEATAVAPEGRLAPSQIGLWNDEQIEGHRRLVDACHAFGTIIVPQIHFGGLSTHPKCGRLTSPTSVKWNLFGNEVDAHELTFAEIKEIEGRFIDAAVRAQKAGYDGVQLHGCHSYLINDFASAVNKRTDEYGGSTENRARFGCNIISGIRKACGDDFIISVRTTGCDPTVEESLGIAECYVKAGCDYLQVSTGIQDIDFIEHDDSLPYNKIAALGVKFHDHFKGIVPVSLVNGIRTPEQVHYVLENDLIDTVDLACGLLADPAFSEAILNGTPYEKCYSCKTCGWGPDHAHICPALAKRGDEEWVW